MMIQNRVGRERSPVHPTSVVDAERGATRSAGHRQTQGRTQLDCEPVPLPIGGSCPDVGMGTSHVAIQETHAARATKQKPHTGPRKSYLPKEASVLMPTAPWMGV